MALTPTPPIHMEFKLRYGKPVIFEHLGMRSVYLADDPVEGESKVPPCCCLSCGCHDPPYCLPLCLPCLHLYTQKPNFL